MHDCVNVEIEQNENLTKKMNMKNEKNKGNEENESKNDGKDRNCFCLTKVKKELIGVFPLLPIFHAKVT